MNKVMDNKTILLRNRILFVLLVIAILTVCSWLIGFGNMLKSIIFVSIGLACLIGGTLFIIYRYGQNERFSFIILAGWYGFSFALLSLTGMLMDTRSATFSLGYILKVAGIIGIGTFLFLVLTTPIGKVFLQFWRKNFSNPTTHGK